MKLELSIHLPRDAASVPTVRRICRQTMAALGIPDGQIDDVILALSEACANIIQHAKSECEYDVSMLLDQRECCLRITDSGGTRADTSGWGAAPPMEGQESGRGLLLMGALMDGLAFIPGADGTSLELVRSLDLPAGSPLSTLGV